MENNVNNDTGNNLLNIKDLTVHYVTDDGVVRAVNDLNLTVDKGETLGLVGETGAGKTTTALSIMQLIPDPPGKIIGGEILLDGENVINKSESEKRMLRGRKVSMIFQDPMTSLNPVMTIGEQVAEVIHIHEKSSVAESLVKAEEMLSKVGIMSDRVKDYPHQLSGGMRQRVVIAIALACNPELLISDEPTTALDVTIQAQVLELMKELKKEFNSAMIMISHDLGVVAEICDRVAVMYAGTIVEFADKFELFENPKHPYTIGLFNSLPDIYNDVESLNPIKGLMPDPMDLPSGCPFHPRCDNAKPECAETVPTNADVGELGNQHVVKCILFEK